MSLEINTSAATRALTDLLGRCSGRAINDTIGEAAADLTRSHFAYLNGSRANKLGGARTNFYAQAVRSTNYRLDPDGATVQVNMLGIAQRYYGGEIRPLPPRKYLTIPACAEAYAKRASAFSGLLHVQKYGSRLALVENTRSDISRTKSGKVRNRGTKGGRVFYWLVPSVYQQPDPGVLPTRVAYEQAIISALTNLLNSPTRAS